MVQRIVEPDIDANLESIDLQMSEEDLQVPEAVTKDGYGRPAGWRAFMWNGSETTIVLAWDIHGKTHDGGRRYLSKKHCLCCDFSGFREHCTRCRKDTCTRCRSGNDRKQVIPAMYLREADVPFPQQVYGEIDCFLPSCTRRGDRGFRDLEEMHMHATGRHTAQFQAYRQVLESQETSQVAILQQQVAALTTAMLTSKANGDTPAEKPVKKRRTRVTKTTGTSDAPLYEKGA